MEKKTIYYIIGGVAVLGIGYYFWNKSKTDKTKETGETTPVSSESSNEESVTKEKEVTTSKEDGVAVKPSFKPLNVKVDGIKNIAGVINATSGIVKLSPQELESKLQSACGKKPSKLALKRNKEAYAKCRSENERKLTQSKVNAPNSNTLDFIGSYDMFSNFESSLDLDI